MNQQELTLLLEGLGTTPHEVALTLMAQGIKGTPVASFNCPVAKYIQRHVGDDQRASVAWKARLRGLERQHMVEADLPYAVDRFVSQFDSGKYPELREEDD